MALLSGPDDLANLRRELPDWEVGDREMERTFGFDDFPAAIGFVAAVAILAEKANHHPDIDVRYNKVTLRLSTHSEGGLTTKDASLAASIDQIE